MPEQESQDARKVFTPAEVAALFRVDVKTVGRWAAAGRIPAIRTPGGHRRYPAVAVKALLAASYTPLKP